MPEGIEWFGQASIKIKGEKTIYIDPWKLKGEHEKADIVLVTHSHYDHLSPDDIAKLQKDDTVIVVPADGEAKLSGDVRTVKPGDVVEIGGVKVEAVPAYNPNKEFHPKANNWVGYVITMGGKRYYHAGDTDFIPEMKELMEIDYAFLPVGGTYTMNAEEAAKAANLIKAKVTIPMHYGDIVGKKEDAEKFKSLVEGEVEILEWVK